MCEAFEALANKIADAREEQVKTDAIRHLMDYMKYTPCVLPILLDANDAVTLERSGNQIASPMRMIMFPRTSKNTKVRFKLLSPGANRLQVVKYLKENLKIDLIRAKEYIDKAPIIIGAAKDFETTKWFTDGLRGLGAIVSLEFE